MAMMNLSTSLTHAMPCGSVLLLDTAEKWTPLLETNSSLPSLYVEGKGRREERGVGEDRGSGVGGRGE